ncbi:MAG: hypothetical protein QF381_00520 [Nitrososphaerales archaeon]|nr:hypothetical protein [Nitrososphaerales archaeon]
MMNKHSLLSRNRLSAAFLIMPGSFMLVIGTTLLLMITGRIEYLLILGLSAAVTIFTGLAIKPNILGKYLIRNEWSTLIFLMIGGTIFAVETSILLILFQGIVPVFYTFSTLIACTILLIGLDILSEINSVKKQTSDLLNKRELIIEQLTS